MSKVNSRKIRLSHIADQAGVSMMTVSRVLNNQAHVKVDTRQRVLRVANELGYTPHASARALSTGKTRMIGLVVGSITSEYLLEIIRGVTDETRQLGYNLVLITSGHNREDELTQVTYLMGGLVDGILLVLPREADRFLKLVSNHNLPSVIIDHRSNEVNLPMVRAANREGMKEMTRFLIQLGHQRIGYIKGIQGDGTCHERLLGYQEALAEAGFSYFEELVRQGDYEAYSGEISSSELLLMNEPPTAIIASNDQMAFGVMATAHRLGLHIPEQLSIVGFDNIPSSARMVPPLTTVHQPLYDMGREAVRMAVAGIEGEAITGRVMVLPTRLVIRSTTGLPRDKKTQPIYSLPAIQEGMES
jgi:LacI family transcriptional regulator